MPHNIPQSQTRAVMEEKAEIVDRLLDRGLTVTQIQAQVRCSAGFVRRIRGRRRAQGETPSDCRTA